VANIKSQIKRNRQNDKKRLRNRVFRGEARLAVKEARATIENEAVASKDALQKAISALDKAVEQGVLHRNNAARRKSNLVKAYNRMAPVKAIAEPAVVEAVVEAAPVVKKSAKAKVTTAKKVEEPAEAKKAAPKKSSTTKKPAAKPAPAKKAAPKKPAAKKATKK
jgi:small subunit ribosomal protein S20